MSPLSRALQSIDLRYIAILVSCFFSFIVIANSPIPNDDAFSYLKAAELFNEQGLNATLVTYGWYWYSVIIACLNNILPLGLMTTAHLVNMLSFALLVYAFITLATEYKATNTVKFFAAVVILAYPTINEMRYFLVRDFAYWAFCLTALIQFIRFNKTGARVHALGWTIAMAAAVLFRLEGLLLMAITPFALFMPGKYSSKDYSGKQRASMFITLLFLGLATAGLILLLFTLAGINLFEVFNFTYRWYLPLLTEYSSTLSGAADVAGDSTSLSFHISEEVESFTGKGLIVLFAGYLYSIISTVFMTLGPPVCLFLGYGFFTGKISFHPESKSLYWFFLGSTLLTLFIFVSIMQFLTTRYAVMASLLLLSLCPMVLESLYLQAQQNGKQNLFRLAFRICVLYFAADSLISFGYSKTYIKDASFWARDNIPLTSSVKSNSFAVAYFSGLIPEYDAINTDATEILPALAAQDYLIIDLPNDEVSARQMLLNYSGLEELARFSNKREDAIIIYQLRP